MLVVRVCGPVIVCALLAVTEAALAQPAPAPGSPPAAPEVPAQAPPVESPPDASPSPASRPSASTPAPAAAVPTLDPAVVQAAAKAKAAGEIIEITDPAVVARCLDLGVSVVDTTVRGARGRFVTHSTLKSRARSRGASHARYFGRSVLADSGAQRERGQFYDCTRPAGSKVVSGTPAGPAPSVGSGTPAGPAPSIGSGTPAAPAPSVGSGTPAAPAAPLTPAAPGVSREQASPDSPAAHVTSTSSGSTEPSSPRRTIVAGALFELAPVTSIEVAGGGASVTRDTATAYGISGNVEAILSPSVALGLSPGLLFGLKSAMAAASDTQFDLRARMRVGKLFGDGFSPYAYGSAGISWIIGPDDVPTASGAVLGAGVGLSHQVEHDVYVTFELGYQYGFQSVTVNDTDLDKGSRLFHLGLGVNWNL